jgi:multiple antibiotic resistance protein
MTLLSAIFLLFLVMDPVGNIPLFVSILKGVDNERRNWVIIRELCVALVILVFFLFCGGHLLKVLQVSKPALSLVGGIILFIIALKMIFPLPEGIFGVTSKDEEPFIVPLAIPLIAGPSSLSTVLLLVNRDPQRSLEWLLALFCAWLISGLILFAANAFSQVLSLRFLVALERLMGMILTTISVQMFLEGIRDFWKTCL